MKNRNLILALIVFGNLTAISAPLTARPNVKKYEAQELQRQEQLRRQRAAYEAQELLRREQIRQQAAAAQRAERTRLEQLARQRQADAIQEQAYAIAMIAREEAAKAAELAKRKSTIVGPFLKTRLCLPEEYKRCWPGDPIPLIGNEDYPPEAYKKKISGIVGFKLVVNTFGRVVECMIVESSGSPLLDETTCSVLRRRARFIPAYDGTGTKVPGQYSNKVNWKRSD